MSTLPRPVQNRHLQACLIQISSAVLRTRQRLVVENLSLRHQLAVLQRSVKRLRIEVVQSAALRESQWTGMADLQTTRNVRSDPLGIEQIVPAIVGRQSQRLRQET